MVLAYMVDHGHDLRDAYMLLKKAHPDADPHPALWRSLITHYQLAYSVEDAVDWALDSYRFLRSKFCPGDNQG
jgi:hypothetical protein